MTVMCEDIHTRIGRQICNGKIDGLLFTEILYADDTLLVMKNTRDTNWLLKETVTGSSYYNMKINNAKCDVIAMNKSNNVKCKDGTKLKHVKEATYLGGNLTEDTNANTEIQGRIPLHPTHENVRHILEENKLWHQMGINVFNAVVLTELIASGTDQGSSRPPGGRRQQ